MRTVPFTLSLVVPVLNEEDAVLPFVEATKPVLDSIGADWEIVFVDDGSRDDTLPLLRDLRRRDPRIRYLSLSRNFGKELALTAGLDYARGDAVIPMDVDLQDLPALISDMVRVWREKEVDVVCAVRERRDGEAPMKRISAALFYRLMRLISPVSIPEQVGDYRLLDRVVVNELKKIRERHRFMKGLFAWVGFRQVSLPFVRAARKSGDTKFSYWKLWNFAVEGMTSFSRVPLSLAMYVGLLVSVCAFVFGAWIVFKTLWFGRDLPGYPSIMVTMLFLGGVQLVALGIIGEYIGRIYDEVKQRPLYIVAECGGIDDIPRT